MMRFLAFPDGHCYVLLGGISTSYQGTDKIIYRMNFSVLIGPISSSGGGFSIPRTITSLKGVIDTSAIKDEQGDRNCNHRQISGDCFALPFDTFLVADTPGTVNLIPNYYFMYGSRQIFFSHIIQPGGSARAKVHEEHYPDKSGPVDWDFRAVFSGMTGSVGFSIGYRDSKPTTRSAVYYDLTFTDLSFGKGRRRTSRMYFSKFESYSPLPVTAGAVESITGYYPTDVPGKVNAAIASLGYVPNPTTSENFIPDLVDDDMFLWGDLSQNCLDQLRYVDVNTISYVNELRDVTRMIPKMGSIRNPKTWANAFLCLRYGLNLTVQDTLALRDGVRKCLQTIKEAPLWHSVASSRISRGFIGTIPYTAEYHYKVYYEPYPNDAMGLIRSMTNWGVYPTLKNCWDLIPLSFVIDWFVNVSSLLGRIDSTLYSQYYTVLSVCRSRKITMDLPVSHLVSSPLWQGMVTLTAYQRNFGFTLDLPVYRVDELRTFHNYAEALALIVQRRK